MESFFVYFFIPFMVMMSVLYVMYAGLIWYGDHDNKKRFGKEVLSDKEKKELDEFNKASARISARLKMTEEEKQEDMKKYLLELGYKS